MKKLASLMQIGEPDPMNGAGRLPFFGGLALFRLGFRPFYLFAALFALASVPVWLASYFGGSAFLSSFLPNIGPLWHMHEMVFGFAVAVVFGFLFTAVRNWTGLWTPRGGMLASIATLWLAGRLAMLLAPPLWAAGLDLLFIPVAIVPLFVVMQRSGKRSNMPLLILPSLLLCANLSFHASVLGWVNWPTTTAIEAALLVLAVLSTVMAGRVVPGFTKNMAPGSAPASYPSLDKAGVTLVIAASASWILALPAWLTAVLAVAAGVVQLTRVAFWAPGRTVAYPLLWILHLAFGWIGLGYVLLGLSVLGICGVSTAMHAIAVGGMSSLILGMMARTTIGHTGRPMRAEHNERLIFLAIQGAAGLRVLANALPVEWRTTLLAASGVCWFTAFLTFSLRFGPYLCQPRVDHREG